MTTMMTATTTRMMRTTTPAPAPPATAALLSVIKSYCTLCIVLSGQQHNYGMYHRPESGGGVVAL